MSVLKSCFNSDDGLTEFGWPFSVKASHWWAVVFRNFQTPTGTRSPRPAGRLKFSLGIFGKQVAWRPPVPPDESDDVRTWWEDSLPHSRGVPEARSDSSGGTGGRQATCLPNIPRLNLSRPAGRGERVPVGVWKFRKTTAHQCEALTEKGHPNSVKPSSEFKTGGGVFRFSPSTPNRIFQPKWHFWPFLDGNPQSWH